MLVEHLLDNPTAVLRFGYVALVEGRTPLAGEVLLELLQKLLCALPVGVVTGGNRSTLAGQAPADRGADATGSAGDQRHPSGELVAGHDRGPFA